MTSLNEVETSPDGTPKPSLSTLSLRRQCRSGEISIRASAGHWRRRRSAQQGRGSLMRLGARCSARCSDGGVRPGEGARPRLLLEMAVVLPVGDTTKSDCCRFIGLRCRRFPGPGRRPACRRRSSTPRSSCRSPKSHPEVRSGRIPGPSTDTASCSVSQARRVGWQCFSPSSKLSIN